MALAAIGWADGKYIQDEADALVRERRPSLVVTPNVDHLILLQNDVEFREIYQRAALVLTDGLYKNGHRISESWGAAT